MFVYCGKMVDPVDMAFRVVGCGAPTNNVQISLPLSGIFWREGYDAM